MITLNWYVNGVPVLVGLTSLSKFFPQRLPFHKSDFVLCAITPSGGVRLGGTCSFLSTVFSASIFDGHLWELWVMISLK